MFLDPVVEDVSVAVYTVPTDAPEADGTIAWNSTTMVLAQIRAGNVTGLGFTYGPVACAAVVEDVLAPLVRGRAVLDVGGAHDAMTKAVRNDGRRGAVGYALSAVDVALWDLKARVLGLPLYRLLGAVRAEVAVYGSGGFTTYSPEQLAAQLNGWTHDQAIPRVKIKIGESWGTCPDRDLERIAQAREIIGQDCALFVDANGAYTRNQAIRVVSAAAEHRVDWFEEPVSSDDLDGLREIRNAVGADVAAGEYGSTLDDFRLFCTTQAVDVLQIDLSRCGGITEWFRAAAIAAAHHLEVSGHCAPHLHAHAAMATPNLRHLEWFHDHVRIENLFFDGTLDPRGGSVRPDPQAPGHGLVLRAADAEHYRIH